MTNYPFLCLLTKSLIISLDEVPNKQFPAVDSANQLLELQKQAEAAAEEAGRPPRSRRKKHDEFDDAPTATPAPDDDDSGDRESDDIEANIWRKHAGVAAESNGEEDVGSIEMSNMGPTGRKSVRWTDHFDGQLTQEHQALSYNRKELSYAPKSKIKFGIWSPMQKKAMAGVGVGCLVLLVILFIVVFVVVRPSTGSKAPQAPSPVPLVPFTRTPPPEIVPSAGPITEPVAFPIAEPSMLTP
jgi:hypothetical protein